MRSRGRADLADQGALTNALSSVVTMATAQKGQWIGNGARDLPAGKGFFSRTTSPVTYRLGDRVTYEGTDSIEALLEGRDITGISAFR